MRWMKKKRTEEMPRKVSQVKKLLVQLRKEELLKLAKKKAKIPPKWTKPKIVETLSVIVSKKDVDTFLSPKVRVKTMEARGYVSRLKGEKLEKKVLAMFSRRGYECKVNVRTKGAEFDVIGRKEGGWFTDDEYVFIECKNKPKVIPADLKKFIGNMNIFIKRKKLDKEDVTGYLVTTGIFDPIVKSQARKFDNIKLKRVKI